MADDITLNTGSGGDTVGADEISGVKYQRVKLIHGANGVNAGDVADGNPLPVDDAGGSLTVDNAALSVVGGGTEATAQRVTIASDSTGVLSVDDNGSTLSIDDGGGAITVDGTVTASDGGGSLTVDAPAGTPVNVQIGDGTRQATVRDTGSSDSLNVAIVDASGNQITTFGGGTEYTEDAAAAANPAGQMMMARRRDTPTASEVSDDGDNIALITTAEGYLRTAVSGTVTVADGGGSITVDGSVNVSDGGGSITVDGTGLGVTGIGSGGSDLGKAEDSSHVTGDVGVLSLAVRRDTPGHGVSADGDYAALSVDSNGALYVTGGGGGTQYTEDAAAATDPVGTALMMVRSDSPSAITSTDGDNVAARGTNNGELYVKHNDTVISRLVDSSGNAIDDDANNALRVSIVSGAGSGGTAMTDDAAFTVGTTSLTPVGGTYRSSRDTVDDNDGGVFAMTQRRALYTALETPAGDSLADDTADGLRIVGPVASGVTVAGGPLLSGARAGATAPTPVGADGTAVALRASRQGELMTTITDDSGDSCMDNTNNALRVNIVTGAGSGGTAMTDDAAFTPGTTSVTPIAGTYRSTRDTVDDNDAGALAMTASRGLYTTIETPAGDSAMDDTNDALRVRMVLNDTSPLPTYDLVTSGDIDAVDEVVFEQADGRATVLIEVTGTFVATLQFEGTAEGSTWTSVRAFLAGTTPAAVTSTTTTGRWYAAIAGLSLFRVRVSEYTSGTASVRLRFSTHASTQGLVGVHDGGLSVSIDDGGNVITVDGSAAHDAAVNNNPVRIGGTASAAAPSDVSADQDAVALWALRNGALVNQLSAAGALIGGDATNGLDVDVTRVNPGTGALALGKQEDAAAADGDVGVAMLAVRRDSASSGVGTDGDYAMLSVDSTGALRVAGGGGGTQYAEDAAHVSADVGTLALAVRRDTAAVGSGTDGDYSTLNVNSSGRLYTSTTVDAALPAGTNNIGDVDVLTLPGTIGGVAHDAAASGCNPVLAGLEARTSEPTAVANGDLVRPHASVTGKQVVHVGAIPGMQIQGNLNETNNTASDVIAAQASGIRIAVMSVTVINKHATVSTTITIRDGTTAKIGPFQCKADGGGFHMNGGGFPLFVGTASTAVTALAGTTGSDVDIFVSGYLTTE